MKHSVYHLRYQLTSGTVELESLRILAHRSLCWAGHEVALYVLGSSHAVSVQRPGYQFTEILACGSPPIGGETLYELVFGRLGVTTTEHARPLDSNLADSGLTCRLQASILPRDRATGLCNGYPADRSLVVEFPAAWKAGDSEAGAVTRLAWSMSERALRIETVHTYPEESLAAYTLTEWLLGEER